MIKHKRIGQMVVLAGTLLLVAYERTGIFAAASL